MHDSPLPWAQRVNGTASHKRTMVSKEILYGLAIIVAYHMYQSLFTDMLGPRCLDAMDNRPPVVESKLQTFLHHHHNHTDSKTVTCNRGNYTYEFPKAPAFIIIGTQKGGTSALSALLDHHPWMESTWYFEPHFFDFNEVMLYYRQRLDESEAMCKVLRTYLQKNFNLKRLRAYPNLMAFEKTPSYILTPNAPARIKATVPWAKIVVTLRNPVDRLVSHHKMLVERKWENRSFPEALADDINVMRHLGYWIPDDDPLNTTRFAPPSARSLRKHKTEGMLYRGCYARQLLPWLEYYELGKDLLVVQYEQLKADPTRVLNQLLDFVGAPRYDFPSDIVNKSYSPRSKTWLTGYVPEVTPGHRAYLHRFFARYNDELVELLGEDWRGVWDAPAR